MEVACTRSEFAKRLRERRYLMGFRTARAFALELGVCENRYSRWERAQTEPSLEMIVQICRTLEVTPNDLISLSPGPVETRARASALRKRSRVRRIRKEVISTIALSST